MARMTRSILTFLAVAVAALSPSAVRVVAQESVSGIGPRCAIERTEIHLGTKPSFRPFQHEFSIRNTGDRTLELGLISRSCSCTTSFLSATSIAPGSHSLVQVGYSPESGARPFGESSHSIQLSTNDPRIPKVTLNVMATLTGGAESIPAVVEFGTLRYGEIGTSQLELALWSPANDDEPITFHTSSPAIEVEFLGSRQSEETLYSRYAVRLDTNTYEDGASSAITFRTAIDQAPLLEVPIKVDVAFPIVCAPDTLLLGVVTANAKRRWTIELSGPDDAIRDVVSWTCTDPRITATLRRSDSASPLTIDVSLDLRGGSGKIDARLMLVNELGKPLGRVTILGFAR